MKPTGFSISQDKLYLSNNDGKLIVVKLDSGNIIVQKSFFISYKDDEETLKTKTQKLEYLSFPEAIIKVFRKN